MAETKLFENWQINEDLPWPFDIEVRKRGGKRYSLNEEDCSIHNEVGRGKKATLYPAVLWALLALCRSGRAGEDIAAGIQRGAYQEVMYYCIEYDMPDGRAALVYNPQNGMFTGGILSERECLNAIPDIQKHKHNGVVYFAMLAYASTVRSGPVYDEEFNQAFITLREQSLHDFADREAVMHVAYICCDNLYWRIECADETSKGAIPFDKKAFASGNMLLSYTMLSTGLYSPNEVTYGKVCIFQKQQVAGEYEIKELQEVYGRKDCLTAEAQELIPSLPESYKAGENIVSILKMITQTPVRSFLITGSAGIGKSTDAKLIAQILKVPYYFFTCGPNTDELELTASMIPNTWRESVVPDELPTLEDLMMDPASALAKMTGTYDVGIGAEDAFRLILERAVRNGYLQAEHEKDFVMVESPIVEACKGPSVLEIQEPTIMERPATLAKLNALLDDTAAIRLLNGDVIHRHPDTVIILTTNVGYIGCRQFNESVLSRMGMVQHREDMTKEQMIERAVRRTGFTNTDLLIKMAEIAVSIREYICNEDIRGGVCEYREFEDWIWAFLVQKNILQAAADTVVAKASMNAEERSEIMTTLVEPYLSGTME